jgi:radical SAM protein with 4Fe4S-binding SPASM domain
MEQGDMDMGLYRRIIAEAAGYGPVGLVLFFRGESLLHPGLLDMVGLAREQGLRPVQLASNGLALTAPVAEALAGGGLDFISFSLDCLDPEIYHQNRTGGDLELAVDNALRFISLVDRRRAKGLPTPEVQVSSVDVAAYRGRMEEFISFWRTRVDRVRVYVEHSADGRPGSLAQGLFAAPNGAMLRRKAVWPGPVVREQISAAADHNQPLRRQPCLKLYNDMVVYFNGQAALCNHDWRNEMNLGDLNHQSVREVWLSAAYEELRRADRAGEPAPGSACLHCDHWRMYYEEDGFLGRLYERARNEGQ